MKLCTPSPTEHKAAHWSSLAHLLPCSMPAEPSPAPAFRLSSAIPASKVNFCAGWLPAHQTTGAATARPTCSAPVRGQSAARRGLACWARCQGGCRAAAEVEAPAAHRPCPSSILQSSGAIVQRMAGRTAYPLQTRNSCHRHSTRNTCFPCVLCSHYGRCCVQSNTC